MRRWHRSRAARRARRDADAAAARLLAPQPLDPQVDRRQRAGRRHVGAAAPHARRDSVGIETVLAGGLWRSPSIRNQLENAILNLAVNARDAMPEGGKLTIETAQRLARRRLRRGQRRRAAGQYVLVAVSDTGTGMAPDVAATRLRAVLHHQGGRPGHRPRPRQVYGFVKQSGGHVKIYSEPGAGHDGEALPAALTPRRAGDGARRSRPARRAPGGGGDRAGGRGRRRRARLTRARRCASSATTCSRRPTAPTGAGAARRRIRRSALLFTDVGLPGAERPAAGRRRRGGAGRS